MLSHVLLFFLFAISFSTSYGLQRTGLRPHSGLPHAMNMLIDTQRAYLRPHCVIPHQAYIASRMATLAEAFSFSRNALLLYLRSFIAMNMLLNIQKAYLRPHCGGAGPFSLGRFSNRMIGGASGIQSHLSDPTYHQSASFSGNADFLDLLIDPSIYMSFIAMLDLQSSYLRAPVFRNNKRRALKLSDSVAYSGLSLKLLFTADQYGCRFIQQITHVFGNNITQKIMQGRISPRDVSDFLECKVQNVKPAHEVVKIFFFYWRCRWAEAYTTSLKASCGASGVFVHSSGDGKQEKETPVWADQVLATDHYSWDIDRNA